MCLKTLTIDEFAMLDIATIEQGLRLCDAALTLLRREKQQHPAPGSRDYDRVCAELDETRVLRKVFTGRLEELEDEADDRAFPLETRLEEYARVTRHLV